MKEAKTDSDLGPLVLGNVIRKVIVSKKPIALLRLLIDNSGSIPIWVLYAGSVKPGLGGMRNEGGPCLLQFMKYSLPLRHEAVDLSPVTT